MTDGKGTPLAASLTAANAHDITQLLPLVEAVPPVTGKVGRPKARPDSLYGDRSYDSFGMTPVFEPLFKLDHRS
jgi:hypothetical protein